MGADFPQHISYGFLLLQSFLHPGHQEAPEAISGSLASMAFRTKEQGSREQGSRTRRMLLSRSCKVIKLQGYEKY